MVHCQIAFKMVIYIRMRLHDIGKWDVYKGSDEYLLHDQMFL